jgi:two-component system chemotaxis sensor kinase CheA
MADEDLYQYFKIEAREIVADLSRDILSLEKEGAGAEALPRLLRQAHTLKGAARVVRLPRIAEIAHAMEDELTPYRGSADAISAEQIGRLLQQVDVISSEIRALDPAAPAGKQSRPSAIEPFESVRVGLAEMDALLSGVSETAIQLDGMRLEIEAVKKVEDRLAALEQQLTATASAPGSREAVEEMRIALNHAGQSLATRADSTDREVAEVRGNIDRLRLLPTSLLFPSLERAVRDAAEMLGKQVAFETSGREQRLESHVLTALGEALSLCHTLCAMRSHTESRARKTASRAANRRAAKFA